MDGIDDDIVCEYVEEIERLTKVIGELVRLWEASLCGVKMVVPRNKTYRDAIDPMWELGRKLGVEEDVDAYIGGIPVADIVA